MTVPSKTNAFEGEKYWTMHLKKFLKSQNRIHFRANEIISDWVVLHPWFCKDTTVLNKTRQLSVLLSKICPVRSQSKNRRHRLYCNVYYKYASKIWKPEEVNYKITSVNELGREILDNESTIKKLHDINNNLKPKYYFLQYGVRDGSLVRWNFNHKIYRVLRFNLNYRSAGVRGARKPLPLGMGSLKS